MKKQFFSLALFAAAWLAGGTVQAWDQPTQVDGVYQIGTASQLEWFAEYINSANADNSAMLTSKAVLTADIDMTGISHTPIGASTTYKYDGEFDGQHHVISNMIIDLPNQENVALFGLVRGNAVIKNIIIDSTCSIKGKNRVAGIIGCVQTKADLKLSILNCVNMAPIHAYSGVASGIIGAGQSKYPVFKMHNCVNTGAITTDATNNYTVAFDGWNKYDDSGTATNSQVWCCYNNGTLNRIDGGNNIFRGSNRSVLNTYDLVNTASNMQSQTNIPSGGFQTVDPLHSGELCYYLNHGIEMMNRTEVSLGEEFTQDLSDTNSIPMPNAAGPKVYQVGEFNCDGTPKGTVTYSNTDGGSRDPHQFDATGYCTVCGAINTEFVAKSEDGFYHLSTVAQVEWFSAMVKLGYGAMNVKLDADIDFGGVDDAHMPIGTSGKKYFGHFDGQKHRIKGMKLTTAANLSNPDYDGLGFFGSVRGGGTSVDGIYTNEVIIENLIIDESCSVEHNKNFAAGLIAHINSRNNNDSHIIIRYCGNEANVYTTGKQAAGILGCVEGTEVGLTIKQCYNTGNITGDNGESAAICGWAGTPKDYLIKETSGCWNIGEVNGIDEYGYNLIRAGKLNNVLYPAVVNCVDLCTTNGGNQGKFTINTANPVASGELCYLLNGDQSTITWTQDLGVEDMPNMWGTTSQVFQAGTVDCAGAAVGGVTYNNVSGETTILDHVFNEDGICTVCNAYQEPSKDDDNYYLLTNIGKLKWFENAVNTGEPAANAKLMVDIDFEGGSCRIGNGTNSYCGTFQGNDHVISNFNITTTTESVQGFFGWIAGGADISGIIFDNSCSISCYAKAGIIGAAHNGGTIKITRLGNEGNVTTTNENAAGIIGADDGGSCVLQIDQCYSTGTIKGDRESAQIAGWTGNSSKITNSWSCADVTGVQSGREFSRYGGDNHAAQFENCFTTYNENNAGLNHEVPQAKFVSGEVAYSINKNAGKEIFYQLIGTDTHPVLDSSHKQVILNGTYQNTASTLALSDMNSFGTNSNFDVTSVTMERTLKAGKWNTFCVPFDMTAAEITDQLGSGTEVKELTGATQNGENYTMTFSDASSIVAGKPYMVKVPGENDVTSFTLSNKTIKGTITPATAGDVTFTGVYNNGNAPQGSFIISNNVFYNVDSTVALKAFRGYITTTSGNNVKALTFDFDDDATGIEGVQEVQEVQGAIYNIAGQRINKMQKGINIVNGKKILK